VYGWCRDWLLGGRSLYTGADGITDYPPNAIVLLSPLALVPREWVVPLWTVCGLVLAPLLAYLGVRAAASADRWQDRVPMVLFLCWASTRTLLQFSVLSMTLAFASMRAADSHRVASGVALGLALIKPQIAGPIALWMLVTGRLRVALVAALVVLAACVAYDARISENPLATLHGYGAVLADQYGGTEGLTGLTSIRGWTRFLRVGAATADIAWIAAAALLLVGVWWLARRDPARPLDAGGMAVPALFSLWSLLAVHHHGNNLILMWPAFIFVWYAATEPVLQRRFLLPIAFMQAALMFDVPIRLGPRMSGQGWASAVVGDFDRALVVLTLIGVAAGWYRLTRTGPRPLARSGAQVH
jgi:hypothetical protein